MVLCIHVLLLLLLLLLLAAHDMRPCYPKRLQLCIVKPGSRVPRAHFNTCTPQQEGAGIWHPLASSLFQSAFPPSPQVLIADFFFILFALAWLGAALAERSALQSTVSGPNM